MKGITNLRLEPGRIEALKSIARHRGISLSELMREMADELIRRHDASGTTRGRRDPVFRLGPTGAEPTQGPDDVARNHDHYLYGLPRRRR